MAQAKIGPSDVPGKKAGPSGSFPIGDDKHARLAIGGATRSERAGNISPAEEAKIKAEARAKLGEGKPKKPKPKKAKAKAPEFAAGQRTFGNRSWGNFVGKQAPGLNGDPADQNDAEADSMDTDE